jgi:hypothetical protein
MNTPVTVEHPVFAVDVEIFVVYGADFLPKQLPQCLFQTQQYIPAERQPENKQRPQIFFQNDSIDRHSEKNQKNYRPSNATSTLRMTPIKFNSLMIIIVAVIHNSAFNIHH